MNKTSFHECTFADIEYTALYAGDGEVRLEGCNFVGNSADVAMGTTTRIYTDVTRSTLARGTGEYTDRGRYNGDILALAQAPARLFYARDPAFVELQQVRFAIALS